MCVCVQQEWNAKAQNQLYFQILIEIGCQLLHVHIAHVPTAHLNDHAEVSSKDLEV